MRRWLILVAIMLAAVAGGASYFASQNAPAPAGLDVPSTIAVTRGDVQQSVTAAGKLVDVRKVTLSMGASGQLSKINVRPGDKVHVGDLLAALDTTDLEREVAKAEQAFLIQQATYSSTLQPAATTLAAAQAASRSANAAYQAAKQKFDANQDQVTVSCFNLQNAADALGRARDAYQPLANDFQNRHYAEAQAAKARLELAQNNYTAELAQCNLAKSSVNDSGLRTAQAQLLEAQTNLTKLISPTATSLITARADLELARLSLEAARRQLALAALVAPFDGVVLEVKNKLGDTVNANAPLISLADPYALAVEAQVDEKDFALVQTDQLAQFLFDARPDITATGHVDQIIPQRASGSQALYPVVLAFDRLPDGLAADMSVDVSIAIARRSDVLRLPRAVVRAKADDTAQVNIWVNDHAEPRAIKVGLRGDLYVEIVAGLSAGDRVVSQ